MASIQFAAAAPSAKGTMLGPRSPLLDVSDRRTIRRRWIVHLGMGLALILACWGAFAGTVDHAFVAGDIEFIVDNEAIKRPSVLRTALTQDYWYDHGLGEGTTGSSYYRPLVVLSNALDYRAYGMEPAGFRITNILLHTFVTGLVFLLALRITRRRSTGWLAALLFALHPLHTPAVVYISGRTSVLVTLFYLAAVLLWLRWSESSGPAQPCRGLLALTALAFGAALLSKETAATLPLLGGCAVVLSGRGSTMQRLRRHLPVLAALVAVLAAYGVVRHAVLGTLLSDQAAPWQRLDLVPALLTIAKTYAYYVEKLIWPTWLSYLPPFVPVTEVSDAAGVASAVALGTAALLLVRAPRRYRQDRLLLAWLAITLLPFSGILPLEYFVKDHYAYLPSVGFCIWLALWATRAHERLRSVLRPGLLSFMSGLAVGLWALLYLGLTSANGATWRDTTALYRRVVALEHRIPDASFRHPIMADSAYRYAVTHFNLAQFLAERGQCSDALGHYDRAEWLTPADHMKLQLHYFTAECHFRLHNYREAQRRFTLAVHGFERDPLPALRLAWLAHHFGESRQAEQWLELSCSRGAPVACDMLRGDR